MDRSTILEERVSCARRHFPQTETSSQGLGASEYYGVDGGLVEPCEALFSLYLSSTPWVGQYLTLSG